MATIIIAGYAYSLLYTVPMTLKNTLAGRFPNAEATFWHKVNVEKWQVRFKENNRDYVATITEDGGWADIKFEVLPKEVPSTIYSMIQKKFPGYEIERVFRVASINGEHYLFNITKDDAEETLKVTMKGEFE